MNNIYTIEELESYIEEVLIDNNISLDIQRFIYQLADTCYNIEHEELREYQISIVVREIQMVLDHLLSPNH
jgi:hypothetical protein